MKPRGYFGIGIYLCKNNNNLGTLWRSAYNFNADFIFTVGSRYRRHQLGDTAKASKHIPMFHFDDFDDFIKHMPKECQLVCLEINKKAENIMTFKHPERAVYLLGAEDEGLNQTCLDESDKIIFVPTNKCMNVAMTGAVVMYDRVLKQNSKS